MVVGVIEEEKRQDDVLNQRTAWQTAHLMNSTGNYKKRIKATDLYKPADYQQEGETEDEQKQNIVQRFDSPAQKEDYMKNLLEKFGKE